MPNGTNRPGFWPVGTLSGAPWQGSVRRVAVDGSTNICLGDPVELQANGIACLNTTANSAAFLGVVVGIEPVTRTTTSVQGSATNLEVKYIPKGTAGKALVCTATDTLYECLANFGAQTANIGEGANHVAADNTAVSVAKISTAVLDTKNPTALTGGTWRIVDIVDRVDNTNTTHGADGANTCVLVTLKKGIAKGMPAAGI